MFKLRYFFCQHHSVEITNIFCINLQFLREIKVAEYAEIYQINEIQSP